MKVSKEEITKAFSIWKDEYINVPKGFKELGFVDSDYAVSSAEYFIELLERIKEG